MPRGRGVVQSTEGTIEYWSSINKCGSPRKAEFADRSTRDGCTASCITHSNTSKNVEVRLVKVIGGGHTEPSVKQVYLRIYLKLVGRQNQDIEMADMVWDFFRNKFTRSELTVHAAEQWNEHMPFSARWFALLRYV